MIVPPLYLEAGREEAGGWGRGEEQRGRAEVVRTRVLEVGGGAWNMALMCLELMPMKEEQVQ